MLNNNLAKLQLQMENLENRLRRSNLHLLGVPADLKRDDKMEYLLKLLKETTTEALPKTTLETLRVYSSLILKPLRKISLLKSLLHIYIIKRRGELHIM